MVSGGQTKRSSQAGWTDEEDTILTDVVKKYNGRNWKKIAESIPGRSDVQCLHRWQKVLNPELVKGPWTKEEDDRIRELVQKHGCKKWSLIAKHLAGRIGKQCRERMHPYLLPQQVGKSVEQFLNIKQGASRLMKFVNIQTVYQNIPDKCEFCKVFDHDLKGCKFRTKTEDKRKMIESRL